MINVGIIGCGNISGIYFKNLQLFKNVELVAAADLIPERAREAVETHEVGKAVTVDELLGDPDIQIVVNLTIPNAHADVAMRAVDAGKSVYNEKPLTISRADGMKLVQQAEEKRVRVGGAPDTFLGAGIQTCRQLIDEGAIGKPISATAFMMCPGHESWHPDPEFYYKTGGGPMFDMGPYYLTALVSMLGPVARITGSAIKGREQRTITSEPKNGTTIDVDVPTHIAGVMDFAGGAVGTIITSFDVFGHNCPRIEIHGTEGSLSVPDPNTFGGPVKLKKGREDWEEIEVPRPYAKNSRGLGVADMAAGIATGRAHRANGQLTLHVLDLMHAVHEASAEGKHISPQTTCERPAAMPADLAEGEID
ncbi:MAG: Gfo/Idh/MocA family protein [Phycisphaerae bacterium]